MVDMIKTASLRNKSIILFVSIIVSFGALEMSLRMYYVYVSHKTLEYAFEKTQLPLPGSRVELGEMIRRSPYPSIIYELKKNMDVIFRGFRIQTNSGGWRDKEFSLEKESSQTIRIAGIGDSFMFGWDIPMGSRYMDLLEKELNQKYPEIKWETYAFGVPGYNLTMIVEQLKQYVLAYQPDMIVYGFVSNDMCLPLFLEEKKDVFSLRESFMKHYVNVLLKRLKYDATPYLSSEKISEKHVFEYCENDENSPKKYQFMLGREAFKTAFDELHRLAYEYDIPLAVMNHQIPFTVFHDLIDRTYDDVFYIDSLKTLQKYSRISQETWTDKDYEKFSLQGDWHPNELGNQIYSRALLEFMEQKGLIRSLQDRAGRAFSRPAL